VARKSRISSRLRKVLDDPKGRAQFMEAMFKKNLNAAEIELSSGEKFTLHVKSPLSK